MSVTVKVDYYSSLCDSFMYGKKFLDLPEKIVDAIDDYFDGQEIDFSGWANPDNVYINLYYVESPKTVLVDIIGFMTDIEYEEHFLGNDGLEEFIELWMEKISERLNEEVTFLGYADGEFHFFQ
ncbi:hypothetical protein EII38_04545 [Streptococcus minor]|uniref:Uncharacterized protein n=1 Tax=Streptococcus minor TaxID=229549 RepID=A0A3P1VBG2_9STRE|nr:hypothetical protein [Streptococcus minor]RRD31499.1 hypothetical protein EII38_04545 [Streptococcus minor]